MRDEAELELLDSLAKARKGQGYPLKITHVSPPTRDKMPYSVTSMLHTAMKKPQAILKISSYGKGRSRIEAHLQYISRHGELSLEDDAGQQVKGLEEQAQLVDSWSLQFGHHLNSRDTLHLVLSSPTTASRQAHHAAAREFLQTEFGKKHHEYVFVLHTDTEFPHVHAVIKMTSSKGKKLNPRKADLHRMRSQFAKSCRAHGIAVEASSRCERGLSGYSQRIYFPYPKGKQRASAMTQTKPTSEQQKAAAIKVLRRNQIIRKRYADQSKKLINQARASMDPKQKTQFQQAARLLERHAKTMPVEVLPSSNASESPQYPKSPQYHYYAVTQGTLNFHGIYEKPKQVKDVNNEIEI